MNVKLTGIILVVTILFFLVVGMDIFINQSRSFKKLDLQDPPESVKSQISLEAEKQKRFVKLPRLVMGNSVPESRYIAALEYLKKQQARRNERALQERKSPYFRR